MYHQHFGLKEVPFSIKVNPNFLFMTEQHKDALAHLLYGAKAEGGFALLTGEVGTGKTTLIRALAQQLPEDVDMALVMNPALSPAELLATICDELKIDYTQDDQRLKTLTDKLYQHLLHQYAEGRGVVVLIDEAQHLQFESLEQIRLLTNLETETKKLLQIILVGQPELDEKLSLPEYRQLAQRITARFYLGPLTEAETAAYISHRLEVAGAEKNNQLFPPTIVSRIYKSCAGVPRLINVLCDRVMLGAYAKDRLTIDDEVVDLATKEVFGKQQPVTSHYTESASGVEARTGGFVLAGLALIAGLILWRLNAAPAESSAVIEPAMSSEQPAEPAGSVQSSAAIKGEAGAEVERVVAEGAGIEGVSEPSTVPAEQAPQVSAASAVSAVENDSVAPDQAEAPGVVSAEPAPWWTLAIRDKAMATNMLLSEVGIETQFSSQPCAAIELLSYNCYEESMEAWQELITANRVAVLHIITPERFSAYVPVIRVSNSEATVVLGDGANDSTYSYMTLPLVDLGELWSSEVRIIWSKPQGFERPFGQGSSNDLVSWVADSFAEIDGREDKLAEGTFTRSLSQRVELFQQSYGLRQDGFVGVNTILKLKDVLGTTPARIMLVQPLEQEG